MITSPFNKPNIIPPNEHPRLMFRKSDIPRIKKNFELGESKFALIHWKELIGMRLSDFNDAIKSGLYNLRICMCIEAKALQAVLEDDKVLANDVVDTITLILDNYDKDKYDIMKARFGGHVVFLTAQIYDWLYDCLSDEKKQYSCCNPFCHLYADCRWTRFNLYCIYFVGRGKSGAFRCH